jgi:hypothetical protein
MSVIVPINDCANLLFENSENIPEDFYVHIMNLLKIYYENGSNLHQIHEFLNKNKNKIDCLLMEKIKESLSKFLPINAKPRKNNFQITCDHFYGRMIIFAKIIVVISFPAAMLSVLILNLTKG